MSTRSRDFVNNYNCYFVTTTFKDWLKLLLNDSYYKILTDSINFCLKKYSCDLVGYVLMPNHIHLIILFNQALRLSDFMRDFKKYTSTKLRIKIDEDNHKELSEMLLYEKDKQKHKVWKDRFDVKNNIRQSNAFEQIKLYTFKSG